MAHGYRKTGFNGTCGATCCQFKDGALATSGDYRNYYEEDGKRYSHIIDPVTGAPVQHNLVSTSVYAEDTMSADAYATALFVMGTEKAKSFAKTQYGSYVSFIKPMTVLKSI